MTTQSKTSVPHGHALCLLSMLLFAAGFPAAEVLLATWGPIALITVRIIACCALMVTIWWAFEGFSAMRKAPWLRGGVIGALGFGTGTILILVAQDMTDAVTAALVAASMPVSAVALEVALDGRRLNKYFVGGLALVLTGGFIATGADLGDARFGLGAALGLLATVLFTWGSRAAVKNLPTSTGLAQATVTMIGAMLFCVATFLVCMIFGLPGVTFGDTDAAALSLLGVYAFGAMAISQILWIIGVGRMGIGLASFHLNAVPFYVMLIALTFGGAWSWDQAFGAGLLAIGVVLAQRSDRRVTVPAE